MLVQPVCQLDEDDANVVHHGEQHVANVFGLARFGAIIFDRPILVTLSTRSPLRAERSSMREGDYSVPRGVMESAGSEGVARGACPRGMLRDFEQVDKVRIAGAAELVVGRSVAIS